MGRLEFLQRLAAGDGEERWLVRAEGSNMPRVAWIFDLGDDAWLRSIADETRFWIGFSHPRVSELLGVSWLGGRLVFAIDDDRGPRLAAASAYLAGRPADRERWTVAQIIAIARGLGAMADHVRAKTGHMVRRKGVDSVHRRIEPDKLFVDVAGHARLRAPITAVERVRTGYVGRATISRARIAWLAPEQCRGQPMTAATDVFALAGNLAFALSGKEPFTGRTDFDLLHAIIDQPPRELATVTPGLSDAIARGLEKKPDDRFATPRDFADALEACVPDAAEYDECMSDLIAEWWPHAPSIVASNRGVLGDRCKMAWDELTPTGGDDIRHCASCKQDVVRVSSLAAVLPLVGQRCIAYHPEATAGARRSPHPDR